MVTKKTVDVSKLDECLGCAYTIKYNGKVISTHNDGYKTLNEAYQAGVDHVYFLTDNYDEYARATTDDFEIIVQDRKGASKKATKALVESLLKEEDESVDDYLRYEADAYYDSKYAGLEDDTKTEDFDDLKDWIWDHVANGSYVEVRDGKTGNSVRISPDEIDYEIIDDPSEWLNDELKDINPLNESCNKKEDCKGKDCKKDNKCKGKKCDKDLEECDTMTFSKKEMEEACKKKSAKKCKGKKCDDLDVMEEDIFDSDFRMHIKDEPKSKDKWKPMPEDPNYVPPVSSLKKKMDADKQARIDRHLEKARKNKKGVKNESVGGWDEVIGDVDYFYDPTPEELMGNKWSDSELNWDSNPDDYLPFGMGDEPYFDIPEVEEWPKDYTEYDSWHDEIPTESLRRRPVRESKINRKPSRSFRRPVK